MSPRRPAHERGHALIEVLIAALVFGLGTLALLRLNATLVRHADAARQRSEATLLAQSRLDALRALLAWRALGTPLPADAGEPGPDGVRGRDAPPDALGTPFDRRWHIADDSGAGLRRIQVQVDWVDRDGHAEPAGVTLTLWLAPADAAQVLQAVRPAATATH